MSLFCCLEFRFYLQSQREAFLWASPSVALCRTRHHIRLKSTPIQTERTQGWCLTPSTAPTKATQVICVHQASHTPSWHRWRAGANLCPDSTTRSRSRSRSTPTGSVLPPSLQRHLTHPLHWRGSPVTPTPSRKPETHWGWAGQSSRATRWRCWGPTRCTRRLRGLQGVQHSREATCTPRFPRGRHTTEGLMTCTHRYLQRLNPETPTSPWRIWRPRSPNPPGGKTWVRQNDHSSWSIRLIEQFVTSCFFFSLSVCRIWNGRSFSLIRWRNKTWLTGNKY